MVKRKGKTENVTGEEATVLDAELAREAERMRLLPRETQADLIAMERFKASNGKLSRQQRDLATIRADKLSRLLGLPTSPVRPVRRPKSV